MEVSAYAMPRLFNCVSYADAQLQICKHQGPTCCTRKMEERYHAAVRRDTLQNILSYSFELKYLILGHASAFQGKDWTKQNLAYTFPSLSH